MLLQQTADEASALEIEDFNRFYNFIIDIILPYEPESHVEFSKFHLAMMWYCCKNLAANAAPRGSLKSTIAARYRPLFRVVDPTPGTAPILPIELLLVTESHSLSKDHLEWIKDHLLNNKRLIERYGELADPATLTWNEHDIELKNGAKIKARSSGTRLRGIHPTDIVVDDLESLENMGKPDLFNQLQEWFLRVLLGTMIPETNLNVIGTIIQKGSLLYNMIMSKKYAGRIWKALNEEDGVFTSIWEQRWTVEWLQAKKEFIGSHAFNAEYQNQPLGLQDQIILPEWIQRHTTNDLPKDPVARYITVDPAFTEERWGDWSAIIVLDEAQDGRLYERMSWRGKITGPELVKKIMDTYYGFKQMNPTTLIQVGIEEVAAQKMLRQSITEKDPTLGSLIIPLRPDKDKRRRLIDVSRYFEMGVISLKTEGIIEEVLAFPQGDKDRVDALVYGLKLYEMRHPVIYDNSFSQVDFMKQLGNDEAVLYLERAAIGMPGYQLDTKKWLEYNEMKDLIEEVEDSLW